MRVLDSVRGKKSLVIDQSVSGPLSLIADFSVLKEHGVEKIFHLGPKPMDLGSQSIVFLTRPLPTNMKWIAAQMKSSNQVEYTLFLVPRRTLICDRILEEEGVYGSLVHIGEYHLDIVPLEDDLLSLETDAFKPLFLHSDTTPVFAMAHAVMKHQVLHGFATRVLGVGTNAKAMAMLLRRMHREYSIQTDAHTARPSLMDSIIVLDRSIDLISPLRTQLTYEGLIDEIFSIKSTFIDVQQQQSSDQLPSGSTSALSAIASSATSKTKKVALNGRDRVFAEVRDLGFEVVGDALSQLALRIQEEEDERHQMTTTSQLKGFTAKLGSLQAQRQSLGIQNTIYDTILKHAGEVTTIKTWTAEENMCQGSVTALELEFIDELISRQYPLQKVLRLLCLACQVSSGLKLKKYDSFRKAIVQTYGYRHLVTLQNLKNAGLLFPTDSANKFSYPQVVKSLSLLSDYDSDNVKDASYVYHGYSPITVRLVEAATTFYSNSKTTGLPTWKGSEDILRTLGAESFEETFTLNTDKSFQKRAGSSSDNRVSLVVFLGGCTMAEVAAIRYLKEKST